MRLISLILVAAPVLGAHAQAPVSPDPVYFEFQVQKPVRPAPSSARPKYPPSLRAAQVPGDVIVVFVVDTAGLPVVTSARILKSNDALFTDAVLAALPDLRFVPAEIDGRKVRQYVQQPFAFRVDTSLGKPAPVTRPPVR